ncbi:MAG: beta-phosphoglucomutase family hydrolase [Pyrinomonadaceae bacterium]|jgi:beta-phosphoglucomutase family hydrolase|nr:beta-phosphoglucomutase family hydrolase [Pyrinomonadaceae bacterium]
MIDYKQFAFIFDMDGTLVDNMHVHTEAWGKLLAENNIPFNEHNFLVKTAGKTNREILPTVFGDISEERINELAHRKESLYREMFLPFRKPIDGLIQFLETSQDLGIKMAVATASAKPNVEFILDGLDLRKFFNAVTTAEEVKNGKPNPDIFLKSAEKVGIDSENCLVFEDAIGGFEAAHRAKMKSIGIATVNSIETILEQKSVVKAQVNFVNLNPQEIILQYVQKSAVTN